MNFLDRILVRSLAVMLIGLQGVAALGASDLKVYFNHSQNHSYTDPYRHITRNGDNFEEVLCDEVARAQQSIWMAVYELRVPSVAKLLAQKIKDGLDVRLVLENSTNFAIADLPAPTSGTEAAKSQAQIDDETDKNSYAGDRLNEYFRFVDANHDGVLSSREILDRDAISILRKAKAPIKDDSADGSRGSGLMHHKFVVIDGETTVVSSANFTLSDFHGDFSAPLTRGNANSMMVVRDARVAQIFADEFRILWGDLTGTPLFGRRKPYRGVQSVTLKSGEELQIQFAGTSAGRPREDSTSGLIEKTLLQAHRSIDLALFVFSDTDIANKIGMLRDQRNVDVKALIEESFAYRPYSKLLDMTGLVLRTPDCALQGSPAPWSNPITTAGVPTLAQGDFLHHKFAVIDNDTVIFGSHNWSKGANVNNDETLMVVKSAEVNRAYSEEFNELYSTARLGLPEWLKQKASEGAARCASPAPISLAAY